MSSISSVGSSYSSSAASRLGPAKQMEKNLTSYLDSKGISQEKQADIKADLEEAIQASMSGGRPNPSKIQASVKGVLEKHGIDSKEIMSKMPPLPAGGKPAEGSVLSSTEQDYMETLLDFLEKRAEDSKKSAKRAASNSTGNDSSQGSNATASKGSSSIIEGGSLDVQA